MQYLLDTNICVFYLRGKLNLEEFINTRGRENCFISEISLFELRYGAENSLDKQKSHQSIDYFLEGISTIPILTCIDTYAKEKVRLRKIGKPVHDEFDLLIGCTAIQNNLILVTDNQKHFHNFKDIAMENWFERT